jgi:hypothetical protein
MSGGIDIKNIKEVDFELSSICNAGCPVCKRRRDGHFSEFKQTYWSLEEVQRVFDIEILENIEVLSICGNMGDAMGNPDIIPIIEWVRQINPTCWINLRTNGGIGTPDQYKRLAELRVLITFGIDGIGEKNELYRVNAKWERILPNLEEFARNAEPWQKEIQFLMWAETLDQLIPIIDLAKQIGCGRLNLRIPFTHGEKTEVHDMKGRGVHFLTLSEHPLVQKLGSKLWNDFEFDGIREEILQSDITASPLKTSDYQIKPRIIKKEKPYTPLPVAYRSDELDRVKDINKQTCFSKNIKNKEDVQQNNYSIYVTYNKMLMPCCMIPPVIGEFIKYSEDIQEGFHIEMMNRLYDIGFENFSLENKTIKQVFESGVLHKFVYDELEKNISFGLCKINCGVCK